MSSVAYLFNAPSIPVRTVPVPGDLLPPVCFCLHLFSRFPGNFRYIPIPDYIAVLCVIGPRGIPLNLVNSTYYHLTHNSIRCCHWYRCIFTHCSCYLCNSVVLLLHCLRLWNHCLRSDRIHLFLSRFLLSISHHIFNSVSYLSQMHCMNQ